MSSHHFVRDGQEPALLILEPVSFPVIESLLEWAPLVMVNERSLDVVFSWGIKVDVVLCSVEANLKYQDQLRSQFPVEILITSAGEELVRALHFLSERRQNTISIQVTHPLDLIPQLENFQNDLTFIIVSGDKKWTFCGDGLFRKWLASGTLLEGHLVESSALVKGVDKTSLGFLVRADGMVEIAQPSGFWIGQSL